MRPPWRITTGPGPVIAVSIHSGDDIRSELEPKLAIGADERMREQDPYTDLWTTLAANRVIVHRSRFECDLNRPRAHCVYLLPREAWGIQVWKSPLSRSELARSRAMHAHFYHLIERLVAATITRYGWFLLLDLHSYNHRRESPSAPPADPQANPDINLGTATVNRHRFGDAVDHIRSILTSSQVDGRGLDVRENVKFLGGNFPRFINRRFGADGCAIAVEIKKTFMDEWTGELDWERFRGIGHALKRSVERFLEGRWMPEPMATSIPRSLRSA